MRRVEISDQVRRFIHALALDPRKELRAALRQLAQYSRRRRAIECVFAERRDLVYEIFEQLIQTRVLGREE